MERPLMPFMGNKNAEGLKQFLRDLRDCIFAWELYADQEHARAERLMGERHDCEKCGHSVNVMIDQCMMRVSEKGTSYVCSRCYLKSEQEFEIETLTAKLHALESQLKQAKETVRAFLEIGKRNLENPKYDSFFNSLATLSDNAELKGETE